MEWAPGAKKMYLVGDFNYPEQIRDIILDDLVDHKLELYGVKKNRS